MIPDLNNGVLPLGVHPCTIEEVQAVFGRFSRTDQRISLTGKLATFLEDARRSGIVAAVILDGSYVTAKPEPEDVDLIVVLRPELDLRHELRPFEYNIQSKRMVRQQYRFDIRVAVDGSELLHEEINFFGDVRPEQQAEFGFPARKGLLRIDL